jgi:hypothetical protein
MRDVQWYWWVILIAAIAIIVIAIIALSNDAEGKAAGKTCPRLAVTGCAPGPPEARDPIQRNQAPDAVTAPAALHWRPSPIFRLLLTGTALVGEVK